MSVEIGAFNDEDGDELGDAGETMSYTATFRNIGNVRVGNARVSHLLGQSAALVCDSEFEAAASTDVRGPMFVRLSFSEVLKHVAQGMEIHAAFVISPRERNGPVYSPSEPVRA